MLSDNVSGWDHSKAAPGFTSKRRNVRKDPEKKGRNMGVPWSNDLGFVIWLIHNIYYETVRLSDKKCILLLKQNHKLSSQTKSIAVTSSNSLVWTVLHIKYNMGSKREDPKCCKTRIKYTIWTNAFRNFLGIEKIGNQENLICLCSSSFFLQARKPVTGCYRHWQIGWHSIQYIYIHTYIKCIHICI